HDVPLLVPPGGVAGGPPAPGPHAAAGLRRRLRKGTVQPRALTLDPARSCATVGRHDAAREGGAGWRWLRRRLRTCFRGRGRLHRRDERPDRQQCLRRNLWRGLAAASVGPCLLLGPWLGTRPASAQDKAAADQLTSDHPEIRLGMSADFTAS